MHQLPMQQAIPSAPPEQTSTTLPFNAAYCRFTKRRQGDAIMFAWVAEQGDEPVLFVGYDATRIPRSIIDVIVARSFGVPAEVIEVTL